MVDLKPSNILFNEYGQLKLCDMGLARRVPADREALAQVSLLSLFSNITSNRDAVLRVIGSRITTHTLRHILPFVSCLGAIRELTSICSIG